MKKVQCEVCGGQDILKQGEYFICQICGTKYSVEEAKKMLKETTEPIQQSTTEKNLQELAQRALAAKDYDNVQKYYEELSRITPNDWRAVFYTLYARIMKTEIPDIDTNISLLKNSLDILEKVIAPHKDVIEKANIVGEIYVGIMTLCAKLKVISYDIYYNGLENKKYYRVGITENIGEYKRNDYANRLLNIAKICFVWTEIQEDLLKTDFTKEQIKKLNLPLWDYAVNLCLEHFTFLEIIDIRNIDHNLLDSLNYYASLIQKYVPDYKNPFSNQIEFNHRRVKVQKDVHGSNCDPEVFDPVSGRVIDYSKWNSASATQNHTQNSDTSPVAEENNSKVGDIFLFLICLALLLIFYAQCN